MQAERICPQCAYRTALPVAALCPLCDIPLLTQERTWTPTRTTAGSKLSPVTGGQIDGRLEATVLDLSMLGARLEHGELLRSGWRYVLALPVRDDALPLHLPLRVVWSRLQRAPHGPGASRAMYESGVAFRDLSRDVERDLATFLGGAEGTHPGPLAGSVASPRG